MYEVWQRGNFGIAACVTAKTGQQSTNRNQVMDETKHIRKEMLIKYIKDACNMGKLDELASATHSNALPGFATPCNS